VANALQALNDSELGGIIGTVLHSLGAIALLGGLAGYVAWHNHLKLGHHHRRVLATSAGLTYVAIFANLVGGFMRTWQSVHPGLSEWSESPWVRAITIKHLFIFAAMAAAVVLFEVVAVRHLRAFKEGKLAEAKHGLHQTMTFVTALGILVAAVLGALAQTVPLVEGEADDGDGGMDGDGDDEQPPGEATALYHNATGQLTSSPAAPREPTATFQVPQGTTDLDVTLNWQPAQFALGFRLDGPNGAAEAAPQPGGQASASFVPDNDGEPPEPGTWTYTILSEGVVVNADWELSIRFAQAQGNSTFLARSVTIPPGQFYEVNTEATVNGSLHWRWTASAPIYYNIHTHFNNQVQNVVEEQSSAASEGNYTVKQAGGHSYLWENTGNLPVTLDYRVWGDWRLDSVFPA
jgi:hypothetical protein